MNRMKAKNVSFVRAHSSDPLVVENLSKVYPNGVEALKEISFRVKEGEIFGLLGPNGAGKTTTMGILTTLVRPTAGRAVVGGFDVMTHPMAVRQSMGVVFQETVLDNEFSGAENLWLHARLWRVPSPKERIAALLDAVGLARRGDDGVSTYSGGMKRRLEIARALLARPRLLFLDEPTLGLDPLVRNELWQSIRELQRQQEVTVLVSTHYLEEAQGSCDRVAIINDGQIVTVNTPASLIASLGANILELGVSGDPSAVISALAQGPRELGEAMHLGTSVSVPSDLSSPELNEIANRLRLSKLGATTTMVRPATLNDVFLHLTSSSNSTRSKAPE
jgi:ABC-2 type transport system ATP-binding protein